MRKKGTTILIMTLLLLIAFEILTTSKAILETVSFSFQIWKNNIFPSLFPFFILSELLIAYGFVEFLGEICKPLMVRFFKTNANTAFIFIMSIISGCPSNAKYTKELLKEGLITEKEATKVLMFSHFSNPLFILGTVSLLFLNNKEAGLLILIVHYSINFLIGFLFRSYLSTPSENVHVSIRTAFSRMHQRRLQNRDNFGTILTNAISNTIQTLLLILGTITVFLVITTILDQNLDFNTFHQGILNGMIEMTQGLKYISALHIPLDLKSSLTAMILSFGGFSVHMQVMSILSDTNVKYLPFLIARIMHATLAGLLVYFLFDPWMTFIAM